MYIQVKREVSNLLRSARWAISGFYKKTAYMGFYLRDEIDCYELRRCWLRGWGS
jgi:hypothetical protein